MKLLIFLRSKIPIWEAKPEYTKILQAQFPHWEILSTFDLTHEQLLRELPFIEALWGWGLKADEFAIANRLCWISSPAAGSDYFDLDLVQERNITYTTTHGYHGIAMSEWLFGMLFAVTHNLFPTYQNREDWTTIRQNIARTTTDLYGKKMLVIGCGSIGQMIAKRAKAFSIYTYGYRLHLDKKHLLSEDYIDQWVDSKDIPTILGEADIVVNLLPKDKSTLKWFDGAKFQQMKSSAIFINLGRGQTVDQEALLDCVRKRGIAKAILDVMEPEPLPEDHPFFFEENIYMTPHISAFSDLYLHRALAYQMQQMKRVDAGLPLEFRVCGPEIVRLKAPNSSF